MQSVFSFTFILKVLAGKVSTMPFNKQPGNFKDLSGIFHFCINSSNMASLKSFSCRWPFSSAL